MSDPTNVELADRLRDWAESMVDLPLDAWRRDLREAADRLRMKRWPALSGRTTVSEHQSITDVLAAAPVARSTGGWGTPTTFVPLPDDEVKRAADALAAADLPLVDRERGIAVIRLDPEALLALRSLRSALLEATIEDATYVPVERDVEAIDGVLRLLGWDRIIGGEQSDE